jgi:hypothetical protein
MTAPATTILGTHRPRIDLLVQAGDPFTISVPVLSGGIPVAATDLTHARAHIRPAALSDQVLYVFSTDEDPPNIEITGTTDGVLVLTATSSDTSDWQLTFPQLAAWWDIEVTDADDVPHQITRPGLITLDPEVTR